jgi:hypothetical protein
MASDTQARRTARMVHPRLLRTVATATFLVCSISVYASPAIAGNNGQGLYLHDRAGRVYNLHIFGTNQNRAPVEWPCTPNAYNESCWGRMTGHYMTIYNWWWVGTVTIYGYDTNFQTVGMWQCVVPKSQVGNDFFECSFD